MKPTDKKQTKVNQMKLVGNYIIYQERLLGSGQYGKVYEASEQNNQTKRYAVKVIPSLIFQQSMSNSQMLQKEIDVLKKLRHENLVCLHEISQSPNNLYLFLDYCNGGDLSQYIDSKPQKKLSESEALEFFKQYVEGYHHLYQSKIIHRDIKPENLMLHNGHIKLGDFGFGRFIEGNMNQTSRMSIKCTPIYASPQLLRKEVYSSKCDVWSSGCLLYKMLYGEYPFIGKDMGSLIKDIEYKSKAIQFPFPADVSVSEDVKNLLKLMFKFDELERISWDDLFKHPVLNKKENILANNEDLMSEQDKGNVIFQSIIQNRNHVLDNDLITDNAQNFQVRNQKVPEYIPVIQQPPPPPKQQTSKSPNRIQGQNIVTPAITPIPQYQAYKIEDDYKNKAPSNPQFYPNVPGNNVANNVIINNINLNTNSNNINNNINNNYNNNNINNNNMNLNNGNLNSNPLPYQNNNIDFAKLNLNNDKPKEDYGIKNVTTPTNNNGASPNYNTPNTPTSLNHQNSQEEDNYRMSLKKLQQEDMEQIRNGKTDKMILFLRNQALFADVTMQLVFTARNKYSLPSFLFYELIYSLTGFYNFNLDLLRKLLNQTFPNKIIPEEDFQSYLSSKQYKKTLAKIEKDSGTANSFFKTLSAGILKEVQQQLTDPSLANYEQLRDFEKFIKLQSANYNEYRTRFSSIAKQALHQLNPDKFEKDLNSLRGIRGIQLFIKLDDFMPITQYLTFDFRFFYDQYMNKVEADKLLRDIKNQII